MNKFIGAIMRAPKRAAGLAMLAAVVLIPAALFAWGPYDRATFTYADPAHYVTFNSIVNNPEPHANNSPLGDERNFVRIKEKGSAQNYGDNVALQVGKTYQVYAFYHNNASSTFNTDATKSGVAHDVTMQIKTPDRVAAGETKEIRGVVSASNAKPVSVWDEATVSSTSAVALRYVDGSATIHSKGKVDGKTLPDTLFGAGTALGYNALDGVLPGCNEYSGYVIYEFVVDQANFTVNKTVSLEQNANYKESVDSTPGGKVHYKIEYKNTGTVKQENVTLKDVLPAGMKYVANSTLLATSESNGVYQPQVDGVTAGGMIIGSYLPQGNAIIKFAAEVVDNSKLEKCGVNTLVNTAYAQTQNGTKHDIANVVVTKKCVPPAPKYACNFLTIEKISKNSFKFSTNYTVENATFKSVTYVIRDAQGKEIARTTNPAYDKVPVGKYTVQAYVTVTVKGVDKTVTSDKCKKPFESTETVVYCKPGIMVGDSRCTPCTVPGKENLPKDSPECAVTVTELPKTGMTENVVALLGLGALVAAIAYYVTSRRAATQR